MVINRSGARRFHGNTEVVNEFITSERVKGNDNGSISIIFNNIGNKKLQYDFKIVMEPDEVHTLVGAALKVRGAGGEA